jgi:hypothetical protein
LNTKREKNCLVVQLDSLDESLESISFSAAAGDKSLILDLSKLPEVSAEYLENFTTFGKNTAVDGSFYIVHEQEYNEQFPVVPTLLEAFDIIEMEDIERQLGF